MFAVLAIILLGELLWFGGVLPETWLGVAVVWPVLAAAMLAIRALSGKPFDVKFAVLAAATVAASCFVTGPKFGGAVFAGVWAWTAARNHPGRVSRFLHVLLLIGVFEALLGITQRFVSPGWILGYYQNQVSDVSGTFINRNHFAGLMSMLTFIPFGLAHTESREGETSRPYIYLWASAFMALAMLCSLSRMGLVAFVITLFIVILLIRSERRRGLPGAALGLALLALVVLGAAWIGVDALIGRYSSLIDSSETVSEARPIIFRDTVRMIADHPWGVGHGNYADAFRQYQTTRLNLLFDHAHNDYLETVAEWGILPAVLFWIGVLVLIVRSVRVFRASDSSRVRGILLGSIGAVVTIMIHSLADFNLQIPSNAMLFFVALGIAAAQDRTLA